jgi:hypothetical protein
MTPTPEVAFAEIDMSVSVTRTLPNRWTGAVFIFVEMPFAAAA